MGITSFKHYDDTISRNARYIPASPEAQSSDDRPIFPATIEGYQKLGEIRRSSGRSFYHYLANSVLIALGSTIASVALGTSCAYGFSRFRIGGAKDWLFFILSTRF